MISTTKIWHVAHHQALNFIDLERISMRKRDQYIPTKNTFKCTYVEYLAVNDVLVRK